MNVVQLKQPIVEIKQDPESAKTLLKYSSQSASAQKQRF